MDSKGNVIDNSHYFEGMKIAEAGECYMNQQGKYPVISLSLKSAKQPDFDMAYQCMIQDIAYEYDRHRYVLLERHCLMQIKQFIPASWREKAKRHSMQRH